MTYQSIHRKIVGDCRDVVPTLTEKIDLVIADPPYDDVELINVTTRTWLEMECPAFVFMYAETLLHLWSRPDQVLFWLKPPSTKNTKRRYSRFVEVIAAYNLDASPFNQDTYWYSRAGVFTDTPTRTDKHPHTKPDGLIEKLIEVNSNHGDTVLDPFSGSGTVTRVCSRLERNSVGIEIEP